MKKKVNCILLYFFIFLSSQVELKEMSFQLLLEIDWDPAFRMGGE